MSREFEPPLVSVGKRHISEGHAFRYVPNHPNAKSNGYYAEHRLVMEIFLSRFLKKEEEVHHKNRDGLDNRFSNLLLTTHSEHSKIHYWERQKKMVEGRRKKYKDGWNPAIKGNKNPNWRGGKVEKKCENSKCSNMWLTFPSLYKHKKFCKEHGKRV